MNIENFEKQAKDLFNRYRPEAENEQIWQNIEPHLKKKKKDRVFILFFWGLALALLLGGLYRSSTVSQNKVEASSASNPVVQQNNYSVQQSASANPEVIAVAPESQKGIVASHHIPGLTQTAAKSHLEMPDAIKEDQNSLHGAPAQAETPRMEQGQVKTNLLAETSVDAGSFTTKDGALANAEVPVVEVDAASSEPSLPQTAAPDMQVQTSSEKVSSTPSTRAKANADDKKKHKAPDTQKPKHNTRKRKSKLHNTFSMLAGPVLPIKILQQNADAQEAADLLQNRKASEKMLEAFDVNGMFTLATKKGLAFKAGIQYRRVNEKFHAGYTEKKTEMKMGVLTQTVDATGTIIAQTMGEKMVTTTTEYSYTSYNSFQYLNVPLGIGFQQRNKKSGWEIAGGLNLNLLFRFNGAQYNAYGQPGKVTYLSSDYPYKRNAGLDFWAMYGYSRNWNKWASWQVSAQIGAPLQRISKADYLLDQRYFYIGINGGLCFQLNEQKSNKHKNRPRK